MARSVAWAGGGHRAGPRRSTETRACCHGAGIRHTPQHSSRSRARAVGTERPPRRAAGVSARLSRGYSGSQSLNALITRSRARSSVFTGSLCATAASVASSQPCRAVRSNACSMVLRRSKPSSTPGASSVVSAAEKFVSAHQFEYMLLQCVPQFVRKALAGVPVQVTIGRYQLATHARRYELALDVCFSLV